MKKLGLYITILALVIITGCNKNDLAEQVINTDNKNLASITKHPVPAELKIEKLIELPEFNPKSIEEYEIDLRGKDLSEVFLKDRTNDLMYAKFNMSTKWPSELPEGFNPEEIMEKGKNPGLNIKNLHSEGITGKTIGIAIIDDALLVDHVEYKDNLKFYEEIDLRTSGASSHGPLVASLAVGKSVGVAPEANLYFIASENTDMDGTINWTSYAKAIDRILEINKSLPKENRIRIISISAGWIQGQKGYKDIEEAISRAKQEGVDGACVHHI